jgi:hypothetical protein
MADYLNYLKNISSPTTFNRKINYTRYNFSKYIKKDRQGKILEIGPGLEETISYLNSEGLTNIDIIDNDKKIIENLIKN